jgi:monovalent cation/hydrogen antiporter
MLEQVEFILAMVAVVFLARLVADRIRVPYSIVLTVCGLVYAVLPGPNLHLDPEVVLVGVIPPLLYGAARRSSLLAIRAHWRPIVSLSVVLVLLTALVIGALLALVVPGLPLSAGLVLGAAVAPPDPVAALSVGRRAQMPPRLGTLIEGEGLLNDATALSTYQVAVAATVGAGFSPLAAGGRFVFAGAGGLAIGVVIGYLVRAVQPRLHDPLLTVTLSLATPALAYVAAESAHASGVLAVVVTGLMAGHASARVATGAGRLQTGAVWQLIEFLLEGFVFLLIGQELPTVLDGLRSESPAVIAAAAAITLGVVLLLRPLWLVLTELIPGRLRGGSGRRHLGGRETVALSWAGTRGVISLAAIFAVPLTVDDGSPFPHRDLLLLCTYGVVLVTLVGQGLTFAPLLRLLRLRADASEEAEVRNQARLAGIHAALSAVDEMCAEHEVTDAMAEPVRTSLRNRADRYRARIEMLRESDEGDAGWTPEFEAGVRLRHAVLDAQREELLRWRDSGRLPDESLRKLERELDHEERTLPER